ncbi:MAG: sigma-70 family RNA polymerase sigma factor [Phaeodactylibacter sp.]|nr:sigma-70 family RNA polymerase sigma factor [Phaeodactylibacter sp.]
MDNKAFYSAFNRSADLLQMSARNFAGNMEDARELYQETAFQISRQKENVEDSIGFREWAIGTMRSIFITSLRKKKHLLKQAPSAEPVNKPTAGLENILARVEELEEAYRVPFWNHFMGLSDQDIARHTGLPVETVQGRIRTARQQLKAIWTEPAVA